MYTLILAVLTPLAVVFTVLHYIGKKAIANGEYDKRGRRVVQPVQAPLGQLVQPAQVGDRAAAATNGTFDDATTFDMLADLSPELVQRIEKAISQRVQPHLEDAYRQGVEAGVAECSRRIGYAL
jgi:hypothetical protein